MGFLDFKCHKHLLETPLQGAVEQLIGPVGRVSRTTGGAGVHEKTKAPRGLLPRAGTDPSPMAPSPDARPRFRCLATASSSARFPVDVFSLPDGYGRIPDLPAWTPSSRHLACALSQE